MRKIACFIIFAMIVTFGGLSMAGEITILQPKGGTFKQSSIMQITWDYTILEDLSSANNQREMEIWLARPSSTMAAPNWVSEIKRVDVFSGSTTWMVHATPGTYRLHFYKRYYPQMGSWAVSEPFTVDADSAPILPLPKMKKPIPIINPVQGQVYYSGTSMTIQWDKSVIANYGTVWLQICWPDGKPAAGAYPTANTGSYVWPIRETAENSLRASVFTPDEQYRGLSGTFQIKLPKKIEPAKIPKKVLK